MKRALSQTPSAIAARERRLFAELDKLDREWHREVVAYMEARGASFDEAFIACGGTIIPDTLSKEAMRGEAA